MTATAHQILHPRHWKRARGHANGIAAEGRTVFVAGQIGWNAYQEFESEDFVAQTRLTWFVIDKRLGEVGAAYRSAFGTHFPAMTMVQVDALAEDRAKVEIEATAVLLR